MGTEEISSASVLKFSGFLLSFDLGEEKKHDIKIIFILFKSETL